MQALVFSELGGPEVLALKNVALPEPAKGEVRVKLTSVGLNRGDQLFPMGRYFYQPEFSVSSADEGDHNRYARVGFEGAGIVDAVGEDVSFRPGDRVALIPLAFDVHRQGCLAEYGVYRADQLIATPATVDDEISGGIWMQYLTAWGGLMMDGGLTIDNDSGPKLKPTVVITAASSSVGLAAIQLAKMASAYVVATTTNDDKTTILYEQGADHVINTKTEDYVEQIKSVTKGRGSDLVFDAVAGLDFRNLVQGSARDARIIIQGMLDRRPMDVHAGVLMKRRLMIKGFNVDAVLERPLILAQAVEVIRNGLESGDLKPVVAARFALCDFQRAFALQSSNRHIGKIIINP